MKKEHEIYKWRTSIVSRMTKLTNLKINTGRDFFLEGCGTNFPGNFMTKYCHEPTYSWLINEGLDKIISLKPINHIKLEQKQRIEKSCSSEIIMISYVLVDTYIL